MGIVESTYAELKQQELKNNPYSCLHMADIDINPHQVEAFTFALSSLELGGAILADEVGLGKTIEAGLVIKYLLCSGKNKILLIMPSNLRKQWQVELEEKFDIDSLIVDSSNWEDYLAKVKSKQAVIIVSYHFASKRKTEFGKIAWDFCVFDEAHRLRNVYKNGSKMANSLYELTKGIPKILLTATPMQNTLLDIYGLVQFIDDRVFYSKQIFSERYLRGEDYNDLKACLEPVVQRTLRKEVAEYIQFSERKEMTIDFELSPMEIELYVMINNYLKKKILYALPNSHRTLITSVIRKLLASSSMAVAETFKVLKVIQLIACMILFFCLKFGINPLLFNWDIMGKASYVVAVISCLVAIYGAVKGIANVRRVKRKSGVMGLFIAFATILSVVVVLINPVMDKYYYGCVLLVCAATILTLIDLVISHNRMSTRPLPQFEYKGGDHRA